MENLWQRVIAGLMDNTEKRKISWLLATLSGILEEVGKVHKREHYAGTDEGTNLKEEVVFVQAVQEGTCVNTPHQKSRDSLGESSRITEVSTVRR